MCNNPVPRNIENKIKQPLHPPKRKKKNPLLVVFARLCGENTAFMKNLMLQTILSLDHKIPENLISCQQEDAAIGLFFLQRGL